MEKIHLPSIKGTINKSFKLRFYPNKTQEKLLNNYFGVKRFIWNYSLSLRTELFDYNRTYINYVVLSKHFTLLKQDECFSWLKDVPADLITQTLIDQDKAMSSFGSKVKNLKSKG